MIKHIVTRGFGNGTFAGEIARVTTRGYGVGEAVAIPDPPSINKRFTITRTVSEEFTTRN